MVETVKILPLEVPRSANVAALEAELSALWRSAAEDPATRQAVTRACALTLLIYVESEEAGREVSGLISEATAEVKGGLLRVPAPVFTGDIAGKIKLAE